MTLSAIAFIALAGVSAFATTAHAGERKAHYQDGWMYAEPKNDDGSARALRAEKPRVEAPYVAAPARDQDARSNANGS